MPREIGANTAVSRAIVDLAQSCPTGQAYIEQILELLEKTLGFDTAFATGPEAGAPLVARNARRELTQLAARTLRYSKTRYAADLLPVFAASEREGGCLDSDFYPSERARRQSVYYQEVLRPAGIRSMIQVCASWRGRPLVRLNLNRHNGGRFRASDLERVLGLLPTLEASLAARAANETTGEIPGLTRRELQVAELVARGLTTAQIGSVLGTSAFTVRNQLSRIFDKLGVDGRAELAAFVAARGIGARWSPAPP